MFSCKSFLSMAISIGLFVPAGLPADADIKSRGTIVGAGAHFSWVVLNEQHRALEQHIGRPISLFGKEQMLGVGCNAGIKTARENRPGHETFGMVCCSLSAAEARENGIKQFPIAREPILILVNSDNPVNNLSQKQVRKIFSGAIRNWKQVGGDDRPIVVVMRPHCKHRPGHWKTILPELDRFREDRVNVRSASEMVKLVNDFTGAIGHTGSAWNFSNDRKVKAIRVSGHAPSARNLKTGKYPYYRTLSAVTNKSPSKDVIKLIEYARTSGQFREIAKKYELSPAVDHRQ